MTAHRVPDVVFALTGDIHRNSRAQRQIEALTQQGHSVHVLHLRSGARGTFGGANVQLQDIFLPDSSGPRFFWRVHRAFVKAAAAVPARAYHASDLYVLPAMNSAADRHHGHLVYDARELYSHVAATIGRPWIRQFWRTVESRYIGRAELVFTVSDGIADHLARAYRIHRPVVVHNVPVRRPATKQMSLRGAVHSSTETMILHLGQLRAYRGCELLVDAMRDVEGGILVFLGDGPLKSELERQAVDGGIEGRVRFMDPVAPDEVVAYARSADIGVTLLEDVCLNHRFALPNKLFEYLTAGLPVIASDLPEIRKVVSGWDVGQVVRPGTRTDLVAALKQAVLDRALRERWQNNIPGVLETFNWEVASQAFLTAYNDLLSNS